MEKKIKKIIPLILGIMLTLVGAIALVFESGLFTEQQTNVPSANLTTIATALSVSTNTDNNNPYNITNVQPQSNYTLDINTKNRGYTYTDAAGTNYPAGMPLVLADNKQVTVKVNNNSGTTTNVHWHGLTVANNEDGPSLTIANGASYTYQFTPTETGTYWYHSHYRPVETQVGEGMYGPLVVKTAADAKYNLDQILMLSDAGEDTGTYGGGTSSGGPFGGTVSSTVLGNAVNGEKGSNIAPLTLAGGQIAQLRFINASTERTEMLYFPFTVRVTHKDGYALSNPYNAVALSIPPGGRADVEVALTGTRSQTYYITNQGNGFSIPVHYVGNSQPKASSPFVPAPASLVTSAELTEAPNFTLSLSMGMGMSGMSSWGMNWTINGQIFPQTGTFNVKVGQTYKVQFNNTDMMSVMHPMHIHGAHFQVIEVNGKPTNDNTWYDTYPMQAGTTTDILIKWTLPGVWMVHCHILAHEDEGMMASFTAT